MKVQATSYVSTTVSGLISDEELLGVLKASGLHVPDNAMVRFYASSDIADVDVEPRQPLRFTIVYRSDAVTTPPASASDDTPSEPTPLGPRLRGPGLLYDTPANDNSRSGLPSSPAVTSSPLPRLQLPTTPPANPGHLDRVFEDLG